MRTRLLLLSAAALATACGTSPLDFCHRTQDVVCDQLFKCTTEQQRSVAGWADTFGTSPADCAAKQKAKLCPDNTNEIVCSHQPSQFNAAKANACLDDVQRASCDASNTAYQDSANCSAICSG